MYKQLEELILQKLCEEVKILNVEMCQELFQMLGALKELYSAGEQPQMVNYHTLHRIIEDFKTASSNYEGQWPATKEWCKDHEGRYRNED